LNVKVNVRRLRAVLFLFLCAALPVVLCSLFGWRFNLSPSHVPVGIWKADSACEYKVGDVVAFDIQAFYAAFPEAAEERMTFSAPRLIKRVAALGGALIECTDGVISIDKEKYPMSRLRDDSWRKVSYPLVVPPDMVWLMPEPGNADALNAYDSRYFGPVPESLLIEKLTPVFTLPFTAAEITGVLRAYAPA
jgi:type IV secretory pathway protease TraF